MARKNHTEHARVTAICVNLALDGVEDDIRDELLSMSHAEASPLLRVLAKLNDRRVRGDVLKPVGQC